MPPQRARGKLCLLLTYTSASCPSNHSHQTLGSLYGSPNAPPLTLSKACLPALPSKCIQYLSPPLPPLPPRASLWATPSITGEGSSGRSGGRPHPRCTTPPAAASPPSFPFLPSLSLHQQSCSLTTRKSWKQPQYPPCFPSPMRTGAVSVHFPAETSMPEQHLAC